MTNLSVIIPTKNRKEYLRQTINNLLCQSVLPDEIIVVDDHSTDGTAKMIASEFNTKAILVTNKGKGPGAARNLGFKIATGKYIKFFDSDDLMTINMLEDQSSKLNVSEKACLYSPYFHARETKDGSWKLTDDAILQYHSVPNNRPLQYWMTRGLFITIPSFLFKNEFLKEVGDWRTDILAYEDWDFLWRIAEKEPFPLHSNASAFLYRIHGMQTTGKNLSDYERDLDKVKCLLNIYENSINRQFPEWDQALFKTKILEIASDYPEEFKLLLERLNFNIGIHKVMVLISRIMQKLGRAHTKNNWQPMHGAVISDVIWREYMKKINL